MKRLVTIFLVLFALVTSWAQTKGDVNDDGAINEVDIQLILDIINQTHVPTAEEEWAADSNDDGQINVVDLQYAINQFLQTDFDIILPNAGEHWAIGDEHTILWNPSDVSAEQVKIELSTDSGSTWFVLIESTENDGNERWKPAKKDISQTCLLKISSIHEYSINDQSDSVFSIVPNGTELKGDINFNCTIDSVDIDVITKIILGHFEPTAKEFWIADANDDYNINSSDVQRTVNWYLLGDWDPRLHVLAASTQEMWQVDHEATFEWDSDLISTSSELGVRMSTDFGQSWTVIFDSTQNDGKETWVPSTDFISSQCLVQLTTATCDISSTSSLFAISPAATPAIRPATVNASYSPGNTICVEIQVGSPDTLVYNLFRIDLGFHYPKNYLNFIKGEIGDLLGNDVSSYFIDEPGTGIVSCGINRRNGSGDVDGYGCLARLWFTIDDATPDNTEICFDIEDVSASDAHGEDVAFTPESHCMTIIDCIECWPGDNNGDGIVNERDILPIGLYWNLIGPKCACRQGHASLWQSCCAEPWKPRDATRVDANGDGVIDTKDISLVSRFWKNSAGAHKISTETVQAEADSNCIGYYIRSGCNGPGTECEAIVYLHNVKTLLGVSFTLAFPGADSIEITSVEKERFMGDDVIFFSNIDNASATVSVGTTRKSSQGSLEGTGNIAIIKFKRSADVAATQTIKCKFVDTWSLDTIGISSALPTTTGINQPKNADDAGRPTEFALQQNYPNPFNPATQIDYQLPSAHHVKIVIMNAIGQHIETLVDEEKNAGIHTVTWNGMNQWGEPASSGVYLVKMTAGDFVHSFKMLLLR